MFENYKNKFATGGHVSMREARHGFSLLGDLGEEPEDGSEMVVRSRKRQRRSTGDMSQPPENPQNSENVRKMSKDEFKELATDDKLVTLFELMSSVDSQQLRLNNIEDTVDFLGSEVFKTNDRVKLLEYKSIDLETINRRHNLVFRGFRETNDEENCEAMVKAMIHEKLGLDADSMFVQRAHRLGALKRRRYRGANSKPNPRPIIICFRDSNDVENILANAYKLRNTNMDTNKDFPKEIVNARSELWSSYKQEKQKTPNNKVYIGFPAKLVVNGKVICDKFPDWRDVLKGWRTNQDSSDSTNKSAESKRVAEGRGQPSVPTRPDDRDAQHNDRSRDRSDTDEERRDSIAAMESEGDELEGATGGRNPEPVFPVIERGATEAGEHVTTAYDNAMNLLSGLAASQSTGDKH